LFNSWFCPEKSKAIPTGRDGFRVQGFKGSRGQVKRLRVKKLKKVEEVERVERVERIKDIGNIERMLKEMIKSLENNPRTLEPLFGEKG